MNRWTKFLEYYRQSFLVGDIDPQNAALLYLRDRFELNEEQCYWLAFLFGCTYCAPTTFYIYNEFPDFENVDVGRLQRWWDANKSKCLFQTDRLRIKTQNLLVPTFESYRNLIGGRTQARAFSDAAGLRGVGSLAGKYRAAWDFALQIRNFGRFSLFIYLELVHTLTRYKMTPDRLEVQHALSSRNGLCYALGLDDLIDVKLEKYQAEWLEKEFSRVLGEVQTICPGTTAWSLETVLCAFKKHCRETRWVGYYLDRQHKEISKLELAVPEGVCWDVLWDYRRETYDAAHRYEWTCKQSTLEEPYENRDGHRRAGGR